MNKPAFLSAPRPRRRAARFTIEQYYTIADTGVLDELGRTELIHGRIEVMNAQHRPHGRAKIALLLAFAEALKGRSDLELGGEFSVEFGLYNVPEPDVFVYERTDSTRGVPNGLAKLIVEVADTSERRDLGTKKRLYARHRIPEYWVVVLRTGRVERFAQPEDGAYTQHDSFGFDEAIASVTLPFLTVPAGTLPNT